MSVLGNFERERETEREGEKLKHLLGHNEWDFREVNRKTIFDW